MPADFLSINDISSAEILTLLDWADAYRNRQDESKPLAGQSVALLFEKPSLRTKLSFDIGIHELGGHAVYLAGDEIGLDVREPVEDMASVVERWVVAIVARVNITWASTTMIPPPAFDDVLLTNDVFVIDVWPAAP